MSVSLNEVQALAKNATRGAGYPWGIAEEAGRAIRWLCAHSLPGCEALRSLLDQRAGLPLAEASPELRGNLWAPPSGALCPLITGLALADRAGQLPFHPIRLETVHTPMILTPFVAQAATVLDRPLTLTWDDRATIVGTGGVLCGQELTGFAKEVVVVVGGRLTAPTPRATRATPPDATWDALKRYASKTHAPSTDRSRALGAGAGTANDD